MVFYNKVYWPPAHGRPWLSIDSKASNIFTGTCNQANVGIRDELRVIPDDKITASSNNGSNFLPKFGRLEGMNAWCPNSSENGTPFLQIDLGQKYVICGVETQGRPGASVRTSFTLSFSNNGSTFTDLNPIQVMLYSHICKFLTLIHPPTHSCSLTLFCLVWNQPYQFPMQEKNLHFQCKIYSLRWMSHKAITQYLPLKAPHVKTMAFWSIYRVKFILL